MFRNFEREKRYRNDPAFHALVNVLRQAVFTLQLAPSEVREAAMFAVYIQETLCPKPIFVKLDDMTAETWERKGRRP